jgi:hypothetical protein
MAAVLVVFFLLGVSGIPLSVAYCSMNAEPESCCCGSGCCTPERDGPSSTGDVSSDVAVTSGGLCCVVVTIEADPQLGEVVLAAQSSKGDAGVTVGSSGVKVTDPYRERQCSRHLIPQEPLTPYALRTHLFTSSFLI